jgi:Flp pilus assembly protein TadB
MPAIQDIQAWYVINSSLSLDCSIPEQQWAATNSSYVAGIPSDGSEHYFMCTAFGLKPKHHLSTGAKVGIAVAVIILFAVLLILALQLYKKRRAKKNSQLAIPLSEHELDQRMSSSGGRPPPYAESIASDIGPLVEPKSGV